MDQFFIDILKSAPQTGLILVALWYGQREIAVKLEKMSRRMDCFESAQHACQLDNARSFASKEEVDCLEGRVNGHESRISRLEGRQ